MGDTSIDPVEQCEGIAEPIGQLVGAGAGVVEGAVAGIPFAEVPPIAIGVAGTVGYITYDQVKDEVAGRWGELCSALGEQVKEDPQSIFETIPNYDLAPPPEAPAMSLDFVGATQPIEPMDSTSSTLVSVEPAYSDFGSSDGSGYDGGSYLGGGGGDSGSGDSA